MIIGIERFGEKQIEALHHAQMPVFIVGILMHACLQSIVNHIIDEVDA